MGKENKSFERNFWSKKLKNYTVDEVLKVARRYKNSKRQYLLVNPLQGKHLPVSPTVALEMMKTLGQKVSADFFDSSLVIGFAETATAIGAVVASELSEETFYLQTTRENFSADNNFIEFFEEHSHAPEQKLFAEGFALRLEKTSAVIFVDDEFSTGKTLLNIVRSLKEKFPALAEKKIVAASIINRLSAENESKLRDENIFCKYLVKLSDADFNVSDTEIFAPKVLTPIKNLPENISFCKLNFSLNPRLGVSIKKYFKQCEENANVIKNLVEGENNSVLVMGTEECMLPAIITGKILEQCGFKTVTHSTTRSPIGISLEKNYPVREGYVVKSLYDSERTTYIYNLNYYDTVIIISDAEFQYKNSSITDLISAFSVHGFGKIIFAGR